VWHLGQVNMVDYQNRALLGQPVLKMVDSYSRSLLGHSVL